MSVRLSKRSHWGFPLVLFVLGILVNSSGLAANPIRFLSTQLNPLPEATALRQVILKDFTDSVDFEHYDDRTVFLDRAKALVGDSSGSVVFGGLVKDFRRLHQTGALESLDMLAKRLADRDFYSQFSHLGKMGSNHTYFIPWMQATYLMAANKRALKYLPKGVDLQRLTYDQLSEWAANMYRATGIREIGFPVGPKGLMPQFLEGYLYPSFTGSMSADFDSNSAVAMWEYFRNLWQYVAPSSLISNRMDQALLHGEVWVAWDHTARLLDAFKQRPDEFVAFPAPIGPKGRGVISVLAGLGIARETPRLEAEKLIEYLSEPRVQLATMENVGFLPVEAMPPNSVLPAGLQELKRAAERQLDSSDSIVSPGASYVGPDSVRFDMAYMLAFSRIILRGRPIQPVLRSQAATLHELQARARNTGGAQ